MTYSEIYLKRHAPVFWTLWKEYGVTPGEMAEFCDSGVDARDLLEACCLDPNPPDVDGAARTLLDRMGLAGKPEAKEK